MQLCCVFDAWLCFLRSIVLTVKQNDYAKNKNICLKLVPGNHIVASVMIKIVTRIYSPSPRPPRPKKGKYKKYSKALYSTLKP